MQDQALFRYLSCEHLIETVKDYIMDRRNELEFQYAERLRNSTAEERKDLYAEAYSIVSKYVIESLTSDNPEERTAGVTRKLIDLLSKLVKKSESIIEIGCGRGYACLMLAPYVKSIIGTDVSEPSLVEAEQVISEHSIDNALFRRVSATELTSQFTRNEFNGSISIDVVEHLHPEDADKHFQQVYHILKPGGWFLIITPNRLTGPHDITRKEYPNSKIALGFHLNELTYHELILNLKKAGFRKFRMLLYRYSKGKRIPVLLPAAVGKLAELLYKAIPGSGRIKLLQKIISVHLIAYK